MKLNKTFGRVATTLVATAMLASLAAVPAFAATDNGSTSFAKTMTIRDDAAFAPSVTFDYQIAAGTPVQATATTPEIKAGLQPNLVVIGDAVFTPTTSITNDTATVNVTVDFSAVTFTEPGIYRYVITETPADDTENPDIVDDQNPTRYVDVVVVNPDEGSTNYKINSVTMLEEAATIVKDGDSYKYVDSEGQAITAKNTGYTSTYNTYSLELKKLVTGSMATMGDTFSFTINFTGGDNGEQFKYGDQTYTFNESGLLSVTGITLQNDASVAISGIPSDVSYQVVENIAQTEGYQTTATVKVGDADATVAKVTSGENAQTVEAIDKSASNELITVTNNKDAVSPTGIAMDIAPYALLVVVAAAGCFVFLRKRRED